MLSEVLHAVFPKKQSGKSTIVYIKWVCHPYVGSATALPDRLSYGVCLLNTIVDSNPENVKLYIMYDIACMMVQHLKVQDSGLLQKITLLIPSFHAYGHKPSCQVNFEVVFWSRITVMYSPLRCEGVGLSDGEVMERLWSYLRRFTRMIKEMRPSHRTDILSHALLFYGCRSKQRLRKLLFIVLLCFN